MKTPPELPESPALTRRAVAYVRRSTDRQEQSLDDQRAAIHAFAANAGIAVIREYVDDAVSGSTSEGREAFQSLIADAQKANPDFEAILVYDIKRFGRVDGDEAGYYRFVLRKRGIEIIYVSEGFNGDPSDDLVRPVRQWLARQELLDLSKVTLRGQISLSDTGVWMGGVPPYGFDLLYFDMNGKPRKQVRFTESGEKILMNPDGTVDETLARGQRVMRGEKDHARLVPGDAVRVAVVQRIFSLYVDHGLGYKPIAHLLNSEGVPSPRDGAWSSNNEGHWAMSTIRAILVNPVYTGAMVWNRRTYAKFFRVSQERATARPAHRLGRGERNPETDWIVVPDTHEPIIPRTVFDAAQGLRASREKDPSVRAGRLGRSKSSPFILSGLVVCSDCGHKFQGYTARQVKHNGRPTIETYYYLCGGYRTKGAAVCTRRFFPRGMFEDYVLERIGARLGEFLGKGGRKHLERLIREELGTESTARDEAEQVRIALAEVKGKIDSLLDSLTPTNKEFVDEKLRALKRERDRLDARLVALGGPRPRVDVRAIVEAGIARLGRLGELLDHGTLDERKMLVQSFLTRMELSPTRNEGAAYFTTLPADVGISSFKMVAGARHEPLQTKLRQTGAPRFEPLQMRPGRPERFVVARKALKKCA